MNDDALMKLAKTTGTIAILYALCMLFKIVIMTLPRLFTTWI